MCDCICSSIFGAVSVCDFYPLVSFCCRCHLLGSWEKLFLPVTIKPNLYRHWWWRHLYKASILLSIKTVVCAVISYSCVSSQPSVTAWNHSSPVFHVNYCTDVDYCFSSHWLGNNRDWWCSSRPNPSDAIHQQQRGFGKGKVWDVIFTSYVLSVQYIVCTTYQYL